MGGQPVVYDIPEERQADFQRYKDSIDLTSFPREWQERFRNKNLEEKDAWFRERFKCLYDAVYLSGFSDDNWEPILGMDFQENPHHALFAQFPDFRPGHIVPIEIHKKDSLGVDTAETIEIQVPLFDLEPIFKKKMILWPRGLFKAVQVDTPIPTPSGFHPISDIHVGDVVFDESGQPCRVTGESPVYYDRPCYEVEFDSGDKIICDEDHLWTTDAHTDIRRGLKSKNERLKRNHHPSVKTTKQIAATLTYGKNNHNHAVVVSHALNLPSKHLLVDPYVLGAWLGDGTASGGGITGIDPTIWKEIEKAGYPVTHHPSNSANHYIQNLVGHLRVLGVLNNKHIPEDYLWASKEQRQSLLQGLMDTDGTITKEGRASFCGTNKKLVEQCRQLVASLGFKPTQVKGYASYLGRAVAEQCEGICYTFNFTAYDSSPIFRLSRKFKRQPKEPNSRGLQKNRMIVAVRPVSSRPVKCIMVDSSSHLYLAGDGYIPTHNTSASVVKIIQFILNYPNIRICFLTGADGLAKRQLSRIKLFFEKPSGRFIRLFPEFCLKSILNKRTQKWEDQPVKMGNQHEFTVPARTNKTFAEPTFAISTAKSVKAGAHFDIMFVDDLVNDQNYQSVKLLEKCYQDYLNMVPLLETNGYLFMTGTRYSFGDTYQRIQELAEQEQRNKGRVIWKFSIQSCWSRTCKNCGHGEAFHCKDVNIAEPPCMLTCGCPGYDPVESKGVLFPEFRTHDGRLMGHTVEGLETLRVELGDDFFANQYENQPIASGSQVFDELLLDRQTLYHLEQIPSYNVSRTFIIGDLAYEGQEGRDYSVLFVCRMFRGQIFVFDCYFGNWDSHAIAVNMVAATVKHRPNMIFPEKFNGWEAYDNVIRSYALTQGLQHMPITWLKGSNSPKAKLSRIGAVKGPLGGRRLWLYAHMENRAVLNAVMAPIQNAYLLLREQLLRWPKLGKNDDFADTIGQTVAAPTGYELDTPPQVESQTNWLRKYNEVRIEDTSDPDFGCGSGIVC